MAITGNKVPSGGATLEVWEGILHHSRNRKPATHPTHAKSTAGPLAQLTKSNLKPTEEATAPPTREDILNEAYSLAAHSGNLLTLEEFSTHHPGRPITIKTRIEEHMSNTGKLFPSGKATWTAW